MQTASVPQVEHQKLSRFSELQAYKCSAFSGYAAPHNVIRNALKVQLGLVLTVGILPTYCKNVNMYDKIMFSSEIS